MDKEFTWNDSMYYHFPQLVENIEKDKALKKLEAKERKAKMEEVRNKKLYPGEA